MVLRDFNFLFFVCLFFFKSLFLKKMKFAELISQYCTNKARRYRQSLNFKQGGKRRVQPKKMTSEDVARNGHFLNMAITNIEHDYAYALELKQAEEWDFS